MSWALVKRLFLGQLKRNLIRWTFKRLACGIDECDAEWPTVTMNTVTFSEGPRTWSVRKINPPRIERIERTPPLSAKLWIPWQATTRRDSESFRSDLATVAAGGQVIISNLASRNSNVTSRNSKLFVFLPKAVHVHGQSPLAVPLRLAPSTCDHEYVYSLLSKYWRVSVLSINFRKL
jgi:hypothetical protein